VDQSTQPDSDAMSTPELLFSDETVYASVIVSSLPANVLPESIFLNPVKLEKSKWLSIPAANDWERVFAGETFLQELFLMGLRAIFAPVVRDTGIVHPPV
jgi:hypothetical protein